MSKEQTQSRRGNDKQPRAPRGTGKRYHSGDRAYRRGATRAASDPAAVSAAARSASQGLTDDEGRILRAAEERGKRAARGEDPSLDESLDLTLPTLRELDPDVHRKAIERVSEFVEQGYDSRRALRMGTAIALQWADNGKPDDRGPHGPALHVMYEDRDWVIVSEASKGAVASFTHMDDALHRAHELATELSSAVYVHGPDGELIDKFENYNSTDGKPFHVIPHLDGWALTRLGVETAYETFTVKRDAIHRGRELAREASSKLVIHYRNGEVARTHSYA